MYNILFPNKVTLEVLRLKILTYLFGDTLQLITDSPVGLPEGALAYEP